MKRTLALLALLAAFATPARADSTSALAATPCGFATTTDLTSAGTIQTGAAYGSVVTAKPGFLRCQVYVNGVAAVTGRVDGRTASLAAAPEVAVAAGPMHYSATVADVVNMCSIVFYDDGTTEWWQPNGLTPTSGWWVPGAVQPWQCDVATVWDPSPEICPVLLTIDKQRATTLASFWKDCEPYSPIL